MKDVLMYWSNICVLHKQEQAFLQKITEELARENIRLEVRFFGLGYPQRLCECLALQDASMPDIIVSTDLEIYEDARIFERFSASLYSAAGWFPLKDDAATRAVRRSDALLPYLSIPLIFATGNPVACEGAGVREMIGTPLAFGGINNSAVKTVVKAVWEQYGQDAAEALLAQGTVTDMPIQAFGRVRTGQSEAALVPTLYALRADGDVLHARCPADGAVLIPSYICARDSVDEKTARRVIAALLQPEITSFFVQSGDLLCHIAGSAVNEWMQGQPQRYLCPSEAWLSRFSPETFYALYGNALPQAAIPFC